MAPLKAVCSPRGDSRVQRTNRGHQWWSRDVHHIADNNRTLCGRNASDWLTLDIGLNDARESANCCTRCRATLAARALLSTGAG
jgi:hypothetical protein